MTDNFTLRVADRVCGTLAVSCVLVLALAIAGCGANRGGGNARQVATTLERQMGIRHAAVTHRKDAGSTGSSTILVLTVSDLGRSVNDPADSALALLKAAYSVNEWKPTSGVRVVVEDFDGSPLGRSLDEAGWSLVGRNDAVPGTVFVGATEMERRFGAWPATTS